MANDEEREQAIDCISRKMLEGWTMLNEHCPQCSTVLVRNRQATGRLCVRCNVQIVTPDEAVSLSLTKERPGERHPAPEPLAELDNADADAPLDDDDDDDWQPPSLEEQREINERRARRDRTSELMGGRLLQGWAMVNDHCSSCGTPLLRRPVDQQLVCVNCEATSPRRNDAAPELVVERELDASTPAVAAVATVPGAVADVPSAVEATHRASTDAFTGTMRSISRRIDVLGMELDLVPASHLSKVRDLASTIQSLAEAYAAVAACDLPGRS